MIWTSGLATKAGTSHSHSLADVTGLQGALDSKSSLSHTHTIAEVTGLQGELNSKASGSDLTSGLSGKANSNHTHPIADIVGLQAKIIELENRLAALETKTSRVSVSGSNTVFSGEVQATDFSMGN